MTPIQRAAIIDLMDELDRRQDPQDEAHGLMTLETLSTGLDMCRARLPYAKSPQEMAVTLDLLQQAANVLDLLRLTYDAYQASIPHPRQKPDSHEQLAVSPV